MELVEVLLLVLLVEIEELVLDTLVEVDREVLVLLEVEEVEVVVLKKAAAISFQATLVVQLMGAVSEVLEEELYSAALTPFPVIRV